MCVLGIPASMSVALFGMHWAGVAGDLMSLGAIDFGFLVDGPIVLLEALIATFAGQQLTREHAGAQAVHSSVRVVMRPVAFAVAIIMLVYIPLLSLEGVEGRLFKPMATTMAFALFGALVYSVVFLPAPAGPVRPAGSRTAPAAGCDADRPRLQARAAARAPKLRWPLLARQPPRRCLILPAAIFAGKGADFVPRIDEGDMVVSLRRPPSINLTEAKRLDLEMQKVLLSFPEVDARRWRSPAAPRSRSTRSARTDRASSMPLKPEEEWITAHDLDALSVDVQERRSSRRCRAPSSSISQPIEDRNNEIISGSRADIQIIRCWAPTCSSSSGSPTRSPARDPADRRHRRPPRRAGARHAELTVKPDRARLARYGVSPRRTPCSAVEAARVGLTDRPGLRGPCAASTPVCWCRRSEPGAEALGDLFVETVDGHRVPLSEVRDDRGDRGPGADPPPGTAVRVVRVEGQPARPRPAVSWVNDAQAAVNESVPADPAVQGHRGRASSRTSSAPASASRWSCRSA